MPLPLAGRRSSDLFLNNFKMPADEAALNDAPAADIVEGGGVADEEDLEKNKEEGLTVRIAWQASLSDTWPRFRGPPFFIFSPSCAHTLPPLSFLR